MGNTARTDIELNDLVDKSDEVEKARDNLALTAKQVKQRLQREAMVELAELMSKELLVKEKISVNDLEAFIERHWSRASLLAHRSHAYVISRL